MQAEAEVEEFLKGEPDFLQCEKLLLKHQETLRELQFDVQKTVPLGLFELHCDEVVRSLCKKTEVICSQLLTRMGQENQKLNQVYVLHHTMCRCVYLPSFYL